MPVRMKPSKGHVNAAPVPTSVCRDASSPLSSIRGSAPSPLYGAGPKQRSRSEVSALPRNLHLFQPRRSRIIEPGSAGVKDADCLYDGWKPEGLDAMFDAVFQRGNYDSWRVTSANMSRIAADET